MILISPAVWALHIALFLLKKKKIPAYFFLKPFEEIQFLERKFPLPTSISLAIPEDAGVLSLSC